MPVYDAPSALSRLRGRLAPWLDFVVHDAILGDAPGRLIQSGISVPLVGGLTGVYVASSLVFATAEIAVPFAILPLALAAFLLPAAWSIGVLLLTYATTFLAEEVVVGAAGLTPLEIGELVAFGLVGFGLRIAVARLVLGREALGRQATELASTQAQVAEAEPDEAERDKLADLERRQPGCGRVRGSPLGVTAAAWGGASRR